MLDDKEYKRVGWHSRRGMLELDLVLAPFYQHQLLTLNDEEQQLYVKLLTCEDQDMFRWFLSAEIPQQEDIAKIVQIILDYNRSLVKS
ncbi:FAD assembly factor SdhE [Sinobacterium norvegicum]|uniref:FAD assembly factor SdhE n=1 Tax=Sinobacterium norvegicum TaxID=1641715 RepID=A0ABM9AB76_9GAMM|nr:succinate dehydrogenase assembly factor 2 [Sinobacterium norvegicum]CAH0990424.1 FAD assembly factor SdhE [Sinobacterium norvegicum]